MENVKKNETKNVRNVVEIYKNGVKIEKDNNDTFVKTVEKLRLEKDQI